MKYQFSPFKVDYQPILTPIGDFKTECVFASHKALKSNTDALPIVVMMSGGIDSELVAESLLLANIPFKAVIGVLQATFAGNSTIFNTHDYCIAERWCIRNNIEIIYCPIDVYKLSILLCEYAIACCGFSPQYACHMYLMKWCHDQGYFFLAGNGEMDFVLRDSEYFMMDEQREFTLANFCQTFSLNGIWQFWKQDARISAAFLNLPTVRCLMHDGVPEILKYKHECFADVFQFEARPKLTGFEHIQQWDSHLRNPMKKVMGHFDDKYYTSVSHFQKGQHVLELT